MVGKCLSQHLTWGGILRLDNEDRTLLQQTNDMFEDMRPRGICAGISGARLACTVSLVKRFLRPLSTSGEPVADNGWWAKLKCYRY